MSKGVGFWRILDGAKTYWSKGVTAGEGTLRAEFNRCFDGEENFINQNTSRVSAIDYGLRYFGAPWESGWGFADHDQIPQPWWEVAKAIRLLLDDDVDHFHLGDARFREMSQKDWMDVNATRVRKGAVIPGVGLNLAQLYAKVTGRYPTWLTEKGKSPENPHPTDLLRNAEPYLPMPKYRLTFVDRAPKVTLYWLWVGDEDQLRQALGDRWPKEWDGDDGGDGGDGGGDDGGDDGNDDGGGDGGDDGAVTPIDTRVLELESMLDNLFNRAGVFSRPFRTVWRAAGEAVPGGEVPRRTLLRAAVAVYRKLT